LEKPKSRTVKKRTEWESVSQRWFSGGRGKGGGTLKKRVACFEGGIPPVEIGQCEGRGKFVTICRVVYVMQRQVS